jgi:hypothetical protein
MKPTNTSLTKLNRFVLVIILLIPLQSCYHYRVLSTYSDPSTEYKEKVLWSYCWGLVNSPQQFVVPNCDQNSLDEVKITSTFGQNLLTVVSLGVVCPIKVQWKCHKPCQRVDDL